MIRLVVERSCGGIEELHVANLNSDASLQFLAQSELSSLKALSLPSSDVTENGFCELILTLPTLVHLDISNCSSIKSKALEVIAETCKSLISLEGAMWPSRRVTWADHQASSTKRADGSRGRAVYSSNDPQAVALVYDIPKLEQVVWAEMPPDALVDVFKRLPVEDRLRTIPRICKAWRKATLDPGCWQKVDVKDWCMERYYMINTAVTPSRVWCESIDRMIRLVVERSCGGIQELHVAYMDGDASLPFLIQSRLSCLKALSIPKSKVTENCFRELILTLPRLVHLDISECGPLESGELELIEQTCKSLPNLKQLKISGGLLPCSEIATIRMKCPQLELLEVESDSDSVSSYDGYDDRGYYYYGYNSD
ncbi:hypothetical protein R1flu_013666 [Riccia fluitans]|uniref:F-box domain-containing protein n=1 Tax=Riccia fluitans TaxID=41844 RepID=A0ABD1YE94_9MARC